MSRSPALLIVAHCPPSFTHTMVRLPAHTRPLHSHHSPVVALNQIEYAMEPDSVSASDELNTTAASACVLATLSYIQVARASAEGKPRMSSPITNPDDAEMDAMMSLIRRVEGANSRVTQLPVSVVMRPNTSKLVQRDSDTVCADASTELRLTYSAYMSEMAMAGANIMAVTSTQRARRMRASFRRRAQYCERHTSR